jgi:hypothetical protein
MLLQYFKFHCQKTLRKALKGKGIDKQAKNICEQEDDGEEKNIELSLR